MENKLAIKKPCGCGGKCKPKTPKEETLSNIEAEFIKMLLERTSIPVVKFTIKSKVDAGEESISQGPVYLENKEDLIEDIEKRGKALISLANKGLVEINYEELILNGDYEIYEESKLYKIFVENSKTDKFQPLIEKGLVSITEKGLELI